MSSIDNFLNEYLMETYGREYNPDKDKNIRNSIKELIKSLHNGSIRLDAVINIDAHKVCERIIIDDFEKDLLDGRAYKELINHFISVIISDHPSHINFGLKDIPSDKLRNEIINVVVSLNNKDDEHEFDLSDENIETIETVIKTRLSLDKTKGRYIFDKSKRVKEE